MPASCVCLIACVNHRRHGKKNRSLDDGKSFELAKSAPVGPWWSYWLIREELRQ